MSVKEKIIPAAKAVTILKDVHMKVVGKSCGASLDICKISSGDIVLVSRINLLDKINPVKVHKSGDPSIFYFMPDDLELIRKG